MCLRAGVDDDEEILRVRQLKHLDPLVQTGLMNMLLHHLEKMTFRVKQLKHLASSVMAFLQSTATQRRQDSHLFVSAFMNAINAATWVPSALGGGVVEQ